MIICPIYDKRGPYIAGVLHRIDGRYVAAFESAMQGFPTERWAREVLGRVDDVLPHVTDIEGRKRGVKLSKLTLGASVDYPKEQA